jgi:hypothetical protein
MMMSRAKLLRPGFWVIGPTHKQAGIERFNAAELKTLKDIDSRARQSKVFRAWLTDLVQNDTPTAEQILADPEQEELRLDYLRDWMSDLGLGIEEHGCVTFWKADRLTKALIGDLPVIVYHHTSTRILKKVKREGLRADVKKVNPHQNSGAGVYVTTETSGPAVDGYHSRARNGHGGDEVTLGIRTHLRDLQPDPDDEDIASVGAVQFILPYVPPQDIFFPSQRPARKRTQKPGEREINLKPGLTLGPNVTSAAIEPGDVIAFDGPSGKNYSGKIINVNGDGKDKTFEIQLENGKETVTLADLLKSDPLLGRGKMVHRVIA